jgi:methyl coenzyme M reductase subunit D
MNINFPFFQSKDSITFYCGSIEYESDNKVLYVDKGGKRIMSVKKGMLYTSFSSIGSVSIDYLNQLVDQCNKRGENESGIRFNAIIVEHHLLKPPIRASSTPTHTRIYIVFEKGEANEPYYFNHISVSPTKGNKEELEQFVIILSTRRYSQVDCVVFDENKYKIKDCKSIDLNKISTKPLVIKVLHSFSETPRPREEKFTVGNVNLLEALIGTHIFVQSGVGHRRYQFTEIIPTSQLSRYFNFVKNRKQEICTSILPSVVYVDVGSFILEVDLTNTYLTLTSYMKSKINNVSKLLEQLQREKPLKHLRVAICSEVVTIESQKRATNVVNNIDIYPEAVLKALTNNIILTRLERLFANANAFEGILSIIRDKLRLPHKIVRINIPIPIDDTVLKSLGIVPVGDQTDIYVAYEIVKNRVGYLKNLLSHYGDLVKLAPTNYDTTDMLIAAFIYSLDQMISSVLDKKHGNQGEVRLIINCDVLASRIALILIEMGLHAVLHLLLKYFRKFHSLREGNLREVIILSIGEERVNEARVARYYLNNLINGFLYRVVTSGDKIKGYMVILDARPFSYANMASLLERLDLNDFIRFSWELLGNKKEDDRCYNIWREESNKIDYYLKLYTHSEKLLVEIKDQIMEYGLGGYGNKITIPMLDARPIIMDAIKEVANKYQSNETEIKQRLNPHFQAIYVTSMPFCFDGCFNCVLLEKNCNSNPLTIDWSISKSIARLILTELEKEYSVESLQSA